VSGVPPPEIAVSPPKFVVPPPGNDVPSPFGEKSLKLLLPEVRFQGLNTPNTISAGADPAGGDYSARPEPLAGRGRPTYKGDGREGRERVERIEEGKRRKGMGRNVAFHHLLLSNLTTECCAC